MHYMKSLDEHTNSFSISFPPPWNVLTLRGGTRIIETRKRSGKSDIALRRAAGAMICWLIAMPSAPTYAQYANSCAQFNVAASRADAGLMQQLSGRWQAPSGPRGIRTITRYPQGYLEYETVTGYSMPGLGNSSTTVPGHGRWFAYPIGGDEFVYYEMTESMFNRGRPNCVNIRMRFLDENTIENQNGGQGHRVGQ